MNARPLSIYIIAGEASGDLLGAHLMAALKKLHGENIRFAGVGGERMQAEGLKSLFPFYELSLLGFVEILPYLFNITARIRMTAEDIVAKQPDMVITVDVPGFSFRVVENLRKQHFKGPFVHYVAPTVWAYRPERAKKFASLFDHLLVLLPFEPPYFAEVGLPCTFVGHPVVAETKTGNPGAFRAKYQIGADTTLISLLPGSRRGELKRHMPVFARAISLLAPLYPKLALAVSVPKHMLPAVTEYFKTCPFRTVITANEEDKKDALADSNVAFVKSGTIALEVAMSGASMLVAYRVHPLSAWMFRRIAKTKFVSLINIILGREIIPELLQEHCTPQLLADAAVSLLKQKSRADRQKTGCQEALKQLLPTDGVSPSVRAAETILGLIKTK